MDNFDDLLMLASMQKDMPVGHVVQQKDQAPKIEDRFVPSVFLTEIDALLDTRAGVLSQKFSKDKIIDIITSDYSLRPREEFLGVSFEDFQALYAQRNEETLAHSLLTPVIKLMKSYASEAIKPSGSSPYKQYPRFVINTHPYRLKDKTLNYIAMGLRAHLGDIAEIDFTHRSYDQITPQYLKDNISTALFYRHDLLLEPHYKNNEFEKVACPEVTLFGPKLSFSNKQEYPQEKDYDLYVEVTRPYINLMLLPVSFFCFIDASKFKKT